jgi:hypothetical protein
MRRQPRARILLVGSDLFCPELERVAAELNRGAARPVLTFHLGALARTGCDFHPDLADHRWIADQLVEAIGRIDGLW